MKVVLCMTCKKRSRGPAGAELFPAGDVASMTEMFFLGMGKKIRGPAYAKYFLKAIDDKQGEGKKKPRAGAECLFRVIWRRHH